MIQSICQDYERKRMELIWNNINDEAQNLNRILMMNFFIYMKVNRLSAVHSTNNNNNLSMHICELNNVWDQSAKFAQFSRWVDILWFSVSVYVSSKKVNHTIPRMHLAREVTSKRNTTDHNLLPIRWFILPLTVWFWQKWLLLTNNELVK